MMHRLTIRGEGNREELVFDGPRRLIELFTAQATSLGWPVVYSGPADQHNPEPGFDDDGDT